MIVAHTRTPQFESFLFEPEGRPATRWLRAGIGVRTV